MLTFIHSCCDRGVESSRWCLIVNVIVAFVQVTAHLCLYVMFYGIIHTTAEWPQNPWKSGTIDSHGGKGIWGGDFQGYCPWKMSEIDVLVCTLMRIGKNSLL